MIKRGSIDSDKISVKNIFELWFRIPEYQRPYRWGREQIETFLEDVSQAATLNPAGEYFLGSFVYQKKAGTRSPVSFDENDLLDGQQRLTTLMLLFAVIRDLTGNQTRKDTCQKFIYQQANPDLRIPERFRIFFETRDGARDFLETFVKKQDATLEIESIRTEAARSDDVTVKSMAEAIQTMNSFFSSPEAPSIDTFFPFLLNNVLMVYVATEDFEDAFQLFTILNNRGLPLSQSDILKAWNLGVLQNDLDRKRYSQFWEDTESEFGEHFDRFLSYIRMLLLKDKARLSLLKEFEDRIYGNDNKSKRPLLSKGLETLKLIEKHRENYGTLFSGKNQSLEMDWKFDNLILIMANALPSTDWIPPLLAYFDKYEFKSIYDFLVLLDRKFSGDWVAGETPTTRIENMAAIITAIEKSASIDSLLSSSIFAFDHESFLSNVQDDVYGRKFARYLLFKLDFYYSSSEGPYHLPETISIEHIAPQNPSADSQWYKDFSEKDREEWTHKIGNLILMGRGKNSSLGRLDFEDKMKKYFVKNIQTNPNSLRIWANFDQWTPSDLRKNHSMVIERIRKEYEINV